MNSCPPPPPTSTFTVVSAMMGGGQLPDRPPESASRLQRMTSHDSQSSTCSLPSTIVPPSTPVRESSLKLKNPDQTTNRPKDDPFKIVSSALTLSLDDLSELKDENHVDLSADQFSPILGEHDHLFSPEELAKWFCKQDDSGRIYFYEENGQPVYNDGGGPFYDEDSACKFKSNLHHRGVGGYERSKKAYSIAMMPAQPRVITGDHHEIVIKEQFKHFSPFQNASINYPPPSIKTVRKDLVFEGTLNRTRTVIAGKVAKRKNWSSCYVALTPFYVYFYKDKKAMDYKPDFVIGLYQGQIEWCQSNKSSRKNCFQVSTFNDQVMLQDDDKERANTWYNHIAQCMAKLPVQVNNFLVNYNKPTLIDNGREDSSSSSFKLKRSSSTKHNRVESEYVASRGGGGGQCNTLSGYVTLPPNSASSMVNNDKRIKIRERLRNFLRKRPTMESLREKGIIKDENIFGCTLEWLCSRDKSNIPKFVLSCIQAIEDKDLKADGIYRACGNLSTVQKLRFEINQENYQSLWTEEDVHVLTGLLKMFFRDMKEPLIPCDRFENLMKFIKLKDEKEKISSFRSLITEMPENNYSTLKYMMQHLLRVISFSDENRMHIQNLSIVFGPTLMRPSNDLNNLALDMMLQMQQSYVVEYLFQNFDQIFTK